MDIGTISSAASGLHAAGNPLNGAASFDAVFEGVVSSMQSQMEMAIQMQVQMNSFSVQAYSDTLSVKTMDKAVGLLNHHRTA